MNNGEEPPVKSILLTLPDDLVLNCLARVSRFYYPSLSLVSKRFRSLLASTELYQTRTLLGRTESCLYVCLGQLTTNLLTPSWFILCQRPNSSRKFLVPISSPHHNSSMSSVAAVGRNIYAIGGGSKRSASCSVMVMDCRYHTWHEAPSMRVARALPSVCTHDGKIYVMGGCDNIDSTNWMEIFDTKTQTWEFLQIPSEEICKGSKYLSISYQGTVYVRSDEKNVSYKLHKGKWREADICMNNRWGWSEPSYCVVENVFYSYLDKKIYWYDLKNRVWITLKCCLEGLPLRRGGHDLLLMADHGGKLAILWEHRAPRKERKIWCAEIALQRRQNSEIWGTLEWFDCMHTISTGVGAKVHALTATVW